MFSSIKHSEKKQNPKKKEFLHILFVNKKTLLELRAKISQFTSLSAIYTDSCTVNLLVYIAAFETKNNRIVLLNMRLKNLETP
jgi:hypothetical protein